MLSEVDRGSGLNALDILKELVLPEPNGLGTLLPPPKAVGVLSEPRLLPVPQIGLLSPSPVAAAAAENPPLFVYAPNALPPPKADALPNGLPPTEGFPREEAAPNPAAPGLFIPRRVGAPNAGAVVADPNGAG